MATFLGLSVPLRITNKAKNNCFHQCVNQHYEHETHTPDAHLTAYGVNIWAAAALIVTVRVDERLGLPLVHPGGGVGSPEVSKEQNVAQRPPRRLAPTRRITTNIGNLADGSISFVFYACFFLTIAILIVPTLLFQLSLLFLLFYLLLFLVIYYFITATVHMLITFFFHYKFSIIVIIYYCYCCY